MITKAQYRASLKAHLSSHQLLVRNIPKELAIVIAKAVADAHTLPGASTVSAYAEHAKTIEASVKAITDNTRAFLETLDTRAAAISKGLLERAEGALQDHGDFEV